MDNYFGFREQVKNYYLEMALAESSEIARLANRASAFYLKDAQVRFSFHKEMDDMVGRHLAACREATTQDGQRNAFVCLRNEKMSLRKQYESLRLNAAVRAVYLEFTADEKGALTYVIKGIGLVAGVSQMVSGGMIAIGSGVTVVGGAFGIMLIAHGVNNFFENVQFFETGRDTPWYVRTFYRKAAKRLGYSDDAGDLVYAGVDLALSLRTLFGKVAISSPHSLMGGRYGADTGRLFRAINTDMVRNITRMGKFSLTIELAGDALTIRGVIN